jgi:hypothetical protein
MSKATIPSYGNFVEVYILHDPIPLDKVDSPYDRAIYLLQCLELELWVDFDPEISYVLLQDCFDARSTMLHWVVKLKWDEKHKIPGQQSYIRALKPWGQLGCCLLELCIQCHAGVGYKVAGYPDAAIWFRSVWLDCVRLDVIRTVRSMMQVKDDKTVRLAEIRHEAAKLKNDENPYDPTQQPHLYHLIKCSLHLAKKSNFERQYWKPYIRALTTCATQMNKNQNGYYRVPIVRQEEQDGKIFLCIYRPLGRGKGLELIYAKEVISKTLAV